MMRAAPDGPGHTPLLRAEGLRLRRGSFALDVPELALARGEVLALLGPNGAGKSTLLHLLALLERPDAGAIMLAGEAVRTGDVRARRRMAVVLQQPLLVDASVRANVALGLKLHHIGKAEREQRVQTWMERTGIAHLARRRARRLSGGEARRVSLARALALAPEVLFLDEPFAALDTPTRRDLLSELPGWLRAAGCATVLVTHERDDALHLAHRVAVLVQGRMRQTGTVEQVFLHPASPDVAGLLGVENLLPGYVTGAEGDLTTVNVGTARLIVAGAHPAGPVLVALHPEHVQIFVAGEPPRGSARNLLTGRVQSVEPAGGQLRLTIDTGFPLTATLTRAAALDLDLAPGREVVVAIKATALHLIQRPEPAPATPA